MLNNHDDDDGDDDDDDGDDDDDDDGGDDDYDDDDDHHHHHHILVIPIVLLISFEQQVQDISQESTYKMQPHQADMLAELSSTAADCGHTWKSERRQMHW